MLNGPMVSERCEFKFPNPTLYMCQCLGVGLCEGGLCLNVSQEEEGLL